MNIDNEGNNCDEEKDNDNDNDNDFNSSSSSPPIITGVTSTPFLGSGINGDISYSDIPETKTYYPTLDEFASPLQYIQSIRDEAMQYGIIKIKPPKGILLFILLILALNFLKNNKQSGIHHLISVLMILNFQRKSNQFI